MNYPPKPKKSRPGINPEKWVIFPYTWQTEHSKIAKYTFTNWWKVLFWDKAYLRNSTFGQFVKVYFAILPCSFCHVYGNILDFSGYIPGHDFLVSAGNSNPIFGDLFTPWFLNFQVYRDFLLNIWHLKKYKRKNSNSHHPP